MYNVEDSNTHIWNSTKRQSWHTKNSACCEREMEQLWRYSCAMKVLLYKANQSGHKRSEHWSEKSSRLPYLVTKRPRICVCIWKKLTLGISISGQGTAVTAGQLLWIKLLGTVADSGSPDTGNLAGNKEDRSVISVKTFSRQLTINVGLSSSEYGSPCRL